MSEVALITAAFVGITSVLYGVIVFIFPKHPALMNDVELKIWKARYLNTEENEDECTPKNRKAYRVEDMPQEHYDAIMNAQIPPEHDPENPDNTVIRELAEALEDIREVSAPSEWQRGIAKTALTKHAERIKKCSES